MSMASERERHRRHLYANMSPDNTLKVWKRLEQIAFGEISATVGEQLKAIQIYLDRVIGPVDLKIDLTTDLEVLKQKVPAKAFDNELFNRMYLQRTQRNGDGAGTVAANDN